MADFMILFFTSGDFPTYWMESSLEISPIEQVGLLTKLQTNSFAYENIHAVKDAICLSSSDTGTFYGKTGTGRVDGQDVNGWFIGFVETANNTYFFATNIRADRDANGGNATEITMSILSDMNIWKSNTLAAFTKYPRERGCLAHCSRE